MVKNACSGIYKPMDVAKAPSNEVYLPKEAIKLIGLEKTTIDD